MAGERIDFHNYYGWRHSPRLHLRYESSGGVVARLSAGQAWQDPEIFAREGNYFFSGRKMELSFFEANLPYGLKAEKGRSAGLSVSYSYRLLPGRGSLLAESYLSSIENQVLADAELPGILRFYNAAGKAESRTAGFQLDQHLGRLFSLRLAYRYAGSWSSFLSGNLARPLHSFHRAFCHLEIHAGKGWEMNAGVQYHGSKRLYGGNEQSPSFLLFQGQVSKAWKKGFEFALGTENAGDYRQKQLVLFRETPQSPMFDAARIWGPSQGRMWYGLIRYRM